MFSRQIERLKKNFNNSEDESELLSAEYEAIDKMVEDVRTVLKSLKKSITKMIFLTDADLNTRKEKSPYFAICKSMESAMNPDQTQFTTLKQNLRVISGFYKTMAISDSHLQQNLEEDILNKIESVLKEILKLQEEKKKLLQAHKSLSAAISKRETESNKKQPSMQKVNEEVAYLNSVFGDVRQDYTISLLNFLKSETQICEILLGLAKYESDFHSDCYSCFHAMKVVLSQSTQSSSKPVLFGMSLDDYQVAFGNIESRVITECCDYILKYGLDHEGIFRKEGTAREIKKLKLIFDTHFGTIQDGNHDVNAVACALKLYLRNLPDSLMGDELFDSWRELGRRMASKSEDDLNEFDEEVINILSQMKQTHFVNLKILFNLLREVHLQASANLMPVANLSLLFTSNIFKCNELSLSDVQELNSETFKIIIKDLILNYDKFFNAENIQNSEPLI